LALASVFAIGAAYGCGGGNKPPETTASNKPADSAAGAGSAVGATAGGAASGAASAATAGSAAPASSGGKSVHELAEEKDYTDPNEKDHEKDGPIEMTSLLPKNPPKTLFPKSTIGDHECFQGLAFTGNHKTDYAALVEKCGTPTGMVKAVEAAEGHLHAKKDQRDVFSLDVKKGLCYRYFAVADNGIADIDILVQKPNGALLATDKTTQPIAIINTGEPWCVTDYDQKLHFAVEVDGHGAGHYTFGVWVRPAK
jgi:hypothetical protein